MRMTRSAMDIFLNPKQTTGHPLSRKLNVGAANWRALVKIYGALCERKPGKCVQNADGHSCPIRSSKWMKMTPQHCKNAPRTLSFSGGIIPRLYLDSTLTAQMSRSKGCFSCAINQKGLNHGNE